MSDFGLSGDRRLKGGVSVARGVGTLCWMAPELLRGGTSTPESDVYVSLSTNFCGLQTFPFHFLFNIKLNSRHFFQYVVPYSRSL